MKTRKKIKLLARIEADLRKGYRRGTTGLRTPKLALFAADAARMQIRIIRRRRMGITHI